MADIDIIENGTPVLIKKNMIGIVLSSFTSGFIGGDHRIVYRILVNPSDIIKKVFYNTIDHQECEMLKEAKINQIKYEVDALHVITVRQGDESYVERFIRSNSPAETE